ncbi:MAG: hypothetical protein CM15mP68_3660 [Pseudomonadota bacterium]|nr:MAG: hypothetical protein CM15mP68_3660 [Pseudomonadota bacterium]
MSPLGALLERRHPIGPCTEFVHNDYADTLSSDNKAVERSLQKSWGCLTTSESLALTFGGP